MKHKGYVSGSLSDEGKVGLGGDSGKSESSLEKGLVDRSDASDVDAKVDNMARCFRTNQRILVRKG